MRRVIFRSLAIAVWLAALAWLVRYEAFPEYFTHTLGGYPDLLARDVLVSDSWMKIRFADRDVGYTHTNLEIDESNPDRYYSLNNTVHLGVSMMGSKKTVHILSTASLDLMSRLRDFSVTFAANGYRGSVTGERAKGETFVIEMRTGGEPETFSLQVPDDAVLYSPLSQVAWKRMRPGHTVTVAVLDPLTMKKTRITIHAVRRERVTVSGVEHDCTVLSTDYEGIQIFTWIDRAGSVVRQESSLGWSMERCTSQEALDASEGAVDATVILQAIAGNLFREDREQE
ncbi:MAG: hypothetical protein HQ559_06430 [Lentisphaerae bacterium]|nr:hypothetical protein [Lentisphaerota bacterium]